MFFIVITHVFLLLSLSSQYSVYCFCMLLVLLRDQSIIIEQRQQQVSGCQFYFIA